VLRSTFLRLGIRSKVEVLIDGATRWVDEYGMGAGGKSTLYDMATGDRKPFS